MQMIGAGFFHSRSKSYFVEEPRKLFSPACNKKRFPPPIRGKVLVHGDRRKQPLKVKQLRVLIHFVLRSFDGHGKGCGSGLTVSIVRSRPKRRAIEYNRGPPRKRWLWSLSSGCADGITVLTT